MSWFRYRRAAPQPPPKPIIVRPRNVKALEGLPWSLLPHSNLFVRRYWVSLSRYRRAIPRKDSIPQQQPASIAPRKPSGGTPPPTSSDGTATIPQRTSSQGNGNTNTNNSNWDEPPQSVFAARKRQQDQDQQRESSSTPTQPTQPPAAGEATTTTTDTTVSATNENTSSVAPVESASAPSQEEGASIVPIYKAAPSTHQEEAPTKTKDPEAERKEAVAKEEMKGVRKALQEADAKLASELPK
eukprot:PhF_6_TR6982/c0_g1_i4/m.10337